MSTSPDLSRSAADELVSVLSQWLAGHVRDEVLAAELARVEPGSLGGDQAELVADLLAELRDPAGHPGERNMLARETIQALFEV